MHCANKINENEWVYGWIIGWVQFVRTYWCRMLKFLIFHFYFASVPTALQVIFGAKRAADSPGTRSASKGRGEFSSFGGNCRAEGVVRSSPAIFRLFVWLLHSHRSQRGWAWNHGWHAWDGPRTIIVLIIQRGGSLWGMRNIRILVHVSRDGDRKL